MEHIELEPDGDLTLEIGSDYAKDKAIVNVKPAESAQEPPPKRQRVFKGYSILVSGRTVAKASPVHRTMLTEPSGIKCDSKIMYLPEDNPEVMLLILRIAHVEFRKIPSALDLDTLYQIAVVSDKYDCVEFLQPWIKGWLEPHDLTSSKIAGNAFICWAFGKERAFEASIERLIVNTVHAEHLDSAKPKSHVLKRVSGPPLAQEMWPPGALERISASRQQALIMIDDILRNKVHDYMEQKTLLCTGPISDKTTCNAAVLGSLQWCLSPFIPHEVPTKDTIIPHSISQILRVLTEMKQTVKTCPPGVQIAGIAIRDSSDIDIIHNLISEHKASVSDARGLTPAGTPSLVSRLMPSLSTTHAACNPAAMLLARCRPIVDTVHAGLTKQQKEAQSQHFRKQALKFGALTTEGEDSS